MFDATRGKLALTFRATPTRQVRAEGERPGETNDHATRATEAEETPSSVSSGIGASASFSKASNHVFQLSFARARAGFLPPVITLR
jgi:hypothetical protein